MRAEIYEDLWEVEAETFQTLPPDAGHPAYPYVPLAASGTAQMVSLRTVVLENQWTRITVCPDLGGAIISWQDLRTGEAILAAPKRLAASAGGVRGATVAAGLQWQTWPDERRLMTGRVDFRVHADESEDGAVAVFLHEVLAGVPAHWTACLTLETDSAALRVEFRLQNLSLLPLRLDSGFSLAGADWDENLCARLAPGTGGLGVVPLHGGAMYPGAGGLRRRGDAQPWLAPGAVEAWSCRLVPFSNFAMGATESAQFAVSEAGVMAISEAGMFFQAATPNEEGRLLLGTADGQTHTAPLAWQPGTPVEFRADQLPGRPTAARVDASGQAGLLAWPGAAAPTSPLPSAAMAALAEPAPGTEEAAWVSAITQGQALPDVSNPLLRPLADLETARRALAEGNDEAAATACQWCLARTHDQVTAWWLHAIAQRRLGRAEEDESLAHAMVLDPMDLRLRAESFLRQPVAETKEPLPFLRPLAANADAAVGVVGDYISLRSTMDAARLVDELIRHRDLPMLRYLRAWSYLKFTRMEAEAMTDLRAAAALPLDPPLPWRPLEKQIIRDLAERFPDDRALQGWRQLVLD